MPSSSPSLVQHRGLLALLPLIILGAGCGRDTDSFAPLARTLERSQRAPDLRRFVTRAEWQKLQAFYKDRKYQRVWTDGGGLHSSFGKAVSLLEGAERDALTPEHYDVEWLRQQQQRLGGLLSRASLDDGEAVAVELRTTAAVVRWATHLSRGRFNPARRGVWLNPKREHQPEDVVAEALAQGRLDDLPSRLRPPHGEYDALLALRSRYAEWAAGEGWPAVSGTRRVREGERDEAVAALRDRLAAEGDLAARHANGEPVLDAEVARALKRFQERHGLPASGALDTATRSALRVPLEQRLRQIEVNIERWRFAPRDLGERHVRVNIPDYYLAVVENDRVTLGMRVVIGAKDTPTPVLTDEMRHIVFSPYWIIPESIANDEVVPALLNDPEYLERNDIEIVRVEGDRAEVLDPSEVDWVFGAEEGLRLRQRPGSRNALGQVKFVLSNNLSIYLHDTPADGLFNRVSRALSHGCVRVERPVTLARTLLDGQDWNEERIQAAMDEPQEQWVRLERPVAVHLMYFTAWVDEDGQPRFRSDVYGHDAAHARALAAAERRMRRPARSSTE